MELDDIIAAMEQDYKPTPKMVRTLLAEINRLQSSLTLSREEGRRKGMEEALRLMDDADNTYSTYEETFEQAVKWIERKVAAIRSEAKGERK